jgi:hypothetical protein
LVKVRSLVRLSVKVREPFVLVTKLDRVPPVSEAVELIVRVADTVKDVESVIVRSGVSDMDALMVASVFVTICDMVPVRVCLDLVAVLVRTREADCVSSAVNDLLAVTDAVLEVADFDGVLEPSLSVTDWVVVSDCVSVKSAVTLFEPLSLAVGSSDTVIDMDGDAVSRSVLERVSTSERDSDPVRSGVSLSDQLAEFENVTIVVSDCVSVCDIDIVIDVELLRVRDLVIVISSDWLCVGEASVTDEDLVCVRSPDSDSVDVKSWVSDGSEEVMLWVSVRVRVRLNDCD